MTLSHDDQRVLLLALLGFAMNTDNAKDAELARAFVKRIQAERG